MSGSPVVLTEQHLTAQFSGDGSWYRAKVKRASAAKKVLRIQIFPPASYLNMLIRSGSGTSVHVSDFLESAV